MVSKKILSTFAALAAVGILAIAGMRAQSTSNDNEDDKQVLHGSFLATVSVNETGRTFKALDTFAPGGGVIVTFFNPTGAQNIAQGSWLRTGDREFALTLEGVSPDVTLPSGQRVSFVSAKLQEKLILDESGDSFDSAFKDQFFDASGNVVRVGTGTVHGTRIVVEPLD